MGDQDLDFSWTLGSGNGRPLESQEIELATSDSFGGSVVASRTLAADATTATVDGLTNDLLHYARLRGVHAVGPGAWSGTVEGTPTAGAVAVTDPNPIPTEVAVKYASPTGTGGGDSVGDPMGYVAGLDWIDDTAVDGGTLRLLSGTYSFAEYNFDNTRDLGLGAWRIVRSHDLDNPAIFSLGGGEPYASNPYGAFNVSAANRLVFYGLEMDGGCTSVGANIPQYNSLGQVQAPEFLGADGAQQAIRLGDSHHVWVKQCKMHHFYTGGVVSDGTTATTSECFLVEDCQFWNNAHGPHWGGSGISILYPQDGLADGVIDPMFKPTLDGATRILGFIARRNIGYRNYQVHEMPNDNTVTASDGNFITTDYWNRWSYEDDTPASNYPRGALIENNLSWGNGRLYAATYTAPSVGVWVRFNTSSHDGITYRHIQTAASTEASPIGGRFGGGWNDKFRVDANLIVIDPSMNNPNAVHDWVCVDTYSGGGASPPSNPPLRTDWNLFVLNAGYTVGTTLSGHSNSITTDPGLGTPPDYLTDNGEVATATIEAWATPAAASSAAQAGCPYAPSDGVDIFWNTRSAGSIGAVVPGGVGTPPAPTGFKAVAQGLSGSGAVAMPTEATTGDAIVYVATRDPARPGTVTAPQGGTLANGTGGGNYTELLVWTDLSWNGSDVPGDFGDSDTFSERLIYVFDGTATAVSVGVETGSSGTTPTWAPVTAPGAGSVIALISSYDIADTPYSKADSSYSVNASQANWVGVTGMSKPITSGGSETVTPAGAFSSSAEMTTILIAVDG